MCRGGGMLQQTLKIRNLIMRISRERFAMNLYHSLPQHGHHLNYGIGAKCYRNRIGYKLNCLEPYASE